MLLGNIMLRMTTSLIIMHMRPIGRPGTFSSSCFDLDLSVLTGTFAKSCNVCEPCREGSYTTELNSEPQCELCFRDCSPSKTHFASFLPWKYSRSELWALRARRSQLWLNSIFCLSQKITWQWFRTARVPPRWSASVSLGSDAQPGSHFQITAKSVNGYRTQLVNTDIIGLFNSVGTDLRS